MLSACTCCTPASISYYLRLKLMKWHLALDKLDKLDLKSKFISENILQLLRYERKTYNMTLNGIGGYRGGSRGLDPPFWSEITFFYREISDFRRVGPPPFGIWGLFLGVTWTFKSWTPPFRNPVSAYGVCVCLSVCLPVSHIFQPCLTARTWYLTQS